MEISGILSRFFENLQAANNQSSQASQNAVDKAFMELLEKQQQQTGANQTLSPKTALHQHHLELRQTPLQQQLYTKNGDILNLSVFRSQIQSKLLESGTNLNQFAPQVVVPQEFKWPSELMATLLQQSFQFIKESLEREEQHKKDRGDKKPDLPDGKAEEDALELLEILFDQFENASDREVYCDWADEAINRAEADLRERHTNVPPVVEMRFKIMHDAILALRNGLEPDFIRERLQQEIKRKKANQD
jgi:hypothetical protein